MHLFDFNLRINLIGGSGKITLGAAKSQISPNGAMGHFARS